MITDTYLIDQRTYTFSNLETISEFDNKKNYLFELAYLGALNIQGDKAQEFLQGQLTCDVRKITPDFMSQGAQCNLQGRILALLDVIYWKQYQLILPKDLLVNTQTSLSKTAMLSRVKLELSDAFQVFGFCLNNPNDLVFCDRPLSTEPFSVTQTEDFYCYCLGDNLYMLLVNQENAQELIAPFLQSKQYRGSLAWHCLQLRHKHLEIYPTTRGLFLPHRLDLHLSNYLSFNKGCYKGQEIIARTHYRAKLKHSLAIFVIESTETLSVGKKLFDISGKTEVGELIDFCPLDNNRYLIAVSILLEHPSKIKIENQESTIRLESIDG